MNDLCKRSNGYWITSFGPSNGEFEFRIPRQLLYLRGLGPKLELDIAIKKLINDNTISWNDCSKAKGKLYDMFWLEFSSHPKDLDDWQVVLKSKFPKNVDRIHYLGIISGWNTRIHLKDSLVDLVEILIKIFPEISSFLPMIVLSNIIMAVLLDQTTHTLKKIDESIKIVDKDVIEFINCALKALLRLDIEKIDEKFLLWSLSWSIRMTNSIDLLNIGSDVIELLGEQEVIDSDIKVSTIQYIETMRDRRQSISNPGTN